MPVRHQRLDSTASFWERMDSGQWNRVAAVALCPDCGQPLEFPRDTLGRTYEQCNTSTCPNRFAKPLVPDLARLNAHELADHGGQAA